MSRQNRLEKETGKKMGGNNMGTPGDGINEIGLNRFMDSYCSLRVLPEITRAANYDADIAGTVASITEVRTGRNGVKNLPTTPLCSAGSAVAESYGGQAAPRGGKGVWMLSR